MSSRNDPFAEIERMFDRMSRQFEEASHMWDSERLAGRLSSGSGSMAVDIIDKDGTFEMTVDLPGFEREDVDIRVTDSKLHIEADREQAHEESEEDYIRSERHHTAVKRMVQLPDEIDQDGVEAHMKNGVLSVTLPKTERKHARKIEVKSA